MACSKMFFEIMGTSSNHVIRHEVLSAKKIKPNYFCFGEESTVHTEWVKVSHNFLLQLGKDF